MFYSHLELQLHGLQRYFLPFMKAYTHIHTCVTNTHRPLIDFKPARMVKSHSTFHTIAKQITSKCWKENMSFSVQGLRGSYKKRHTQWCKSSMYASGISLKPEC